LTTLSVSKGTDEVFLEAGGSVRPSAQAVCCWLLPPSRQAAS